LVNGDVYFFLPSHIAYPRVVVGLIPQNIIMWSVECGV
jgi:hypothetical protein